MMRGSVFNGRNVPLCGQVSNGFRCTEPRNGNERLCPDCNPRRQTVVDITKPHWKCDCGFIAMPLSDKTRCNCVDIYDQRWTYVEGKS